MRVTLNFYLPILGETEEKAWEQSLFDYYGAGVTTLLIRGFNPVEDAIAYSRDVNDEGKHSGTVFRRLIATAPFCQLPFFADLLWGAASNWGLTSLAQSSKLKLS